MNTGRSVTPRPGDPPELVEVRRLLTAARQLAEWRAGQFLVRALLCERSLWVVAAGDDGCLLALRAAGVAAGSLAVHYISTDTRALRVEATSDIGAFRITLRTAVRDQLTTICSKAVLIPSHHFRIGSQPRDLFVLEPRDEDPQSSGRLYSKQSGFQTGSLFGVCERGRGSSFFYLQNFTSLKAYFEDTHTNPKDSVGGSWPTLGFLLPASDDRPLFASNEYTLSDSYLAVRVRAPISEGETARHYLDALAQVTQMLDAPPRSHHNWPARAETTVYDLSRSPECMVTVNGLHYLAPYVGDKTKPPESMVQLTLLVALLEYEKWTGRTFALTRDLRATLNSFVDERLGTIVRWLPGQRFTSREDEHQSHDAMDSWYLYHILFNLARLAEGGDHEARRILTLSLPFAIRVARRFSYRWPIFFNLQTLDVIQAEARKGSGGENDVSGLYALVMLHAHQIFGRKGFLEEAKRAANAMEGFGFALAYQTNTTGFAAEAALRLWKLTGERRYCDLMLVALANIFANTALWESGYGNARWYSTYFGLYPLRGAPYIAAYEEAEALAKFHEFLRLGGEDLPASVTLLISEYAKWLVSRGWGYYPSELPAQALASKQRNGAVRRELSIPLEDLQDGLERSGQVGQEIYGAGLALVCATRHYKRLPDQPFVLFCEYPLQPAGVNRFRVIGDPAMRCRVRLIPVDADAEVPRDAVVVSGASRRKAVYSVEGHLQIEVRGNDTLVVRGRVRRARSKTAT